MPCVLRSLFPVLAVALVTSLVLSGESLAEEGTPQKKAPAKADAAEVDPAKEAAPDRVLKPFLWVIPGDVPNYLFGTAHSTDPRITAMHPVSRAAFDKVDAAYFEVDMIKDAAAQMAAIKLPAGKKAEDTLPAELLKRLDARLTKIHPMITRAAIGEVKPFAWVVLLPSIYEQMKKPGVPMLDVMLHGEALRAGKTVGGLEKPAEQTAFLDKVTDGEAALMLGLLLDQWDEADKQGKTMTDDLVGHYLRGDAKGLHDYAMEMMAGEEVPKELAERMMKGLSYDRNERMAKAIATHLKTNPKRSHFFAVGTMHLVGKLSVQHYLQEMGIETRRVETAAPTTDAPTTEAPTTGDAGSPKPAPKEKTPVGAGAGVR